MTRPSLDLYPPPGKPSTPPTWEDIERLALNYPFVRNAVTMVRRGDWTREQALIAVVFGLTETFQRQFHAEVERLNATIPNRIIIPTQEPNDG